MTDKVEFFDALKSILNEVQYGESSAAHTRVAWHLAEAVADGLDIECAKQLMKKIGDAISASNDDCYNRGYDDGHADGYYEGEEAALDC